jgi:O-antigen ligase
MPGRSSHFKRSFLPLRPNHTFGLLAVLLVATFLMGGASRPDVESLALLRPLACVAAAVGIMGLDRATLRAWRLPFLLLGGLAAVMVVQLVPLPPSLWTQLPERETIRQLDAAVGLADAWRPISLSPMKTANSLASLVVPFAVLVLFCQLGEAHRRRTLVVLVALAVAGALVGFLQLGAGPNSGLYAYEVTHSINAVGFFANRNHHTAFLAAAMLVALHLAMDRRQPGRDMASILCLAAALLLLLAVLGNVSRGGLLSAGVALVLVPLVLPRPEGGGNQTAASWLSGRWVRTGLFALSALGILMLFAVSQRSPALARLLSGENIEEMRIAILPEVMKMAVDFQPFGAGFGAFEYAYRIREPAALLVPNYFNQAHNDWLQLAIEGGIAGVLLLLLAAVAVAVRVVRLVRKSDGSDAIARSRALLGLAVLGVIGFASLFDYPLRVPSVMAVATIAFALLIGPILVQNQRHG